MNMFKLLAAISVISMQLQEALADKTLTVKEMCELADKTVKELTGVGLDQIGFSFKEEDGKKEFKFVIIDKK